MDSLNLVAQKPEIAKSPRFSDLSNNSWYPSPENLTSAQSNTCNNSLYDHQSHFAYERQNMGIYLISNSRAKWQPTKIVKIKLAKNLDKSFNSYTASNEILEAFYQG